MLLHSDCCSSLIASCWHAALVPAPAQDAEHAKSEVSPLLGTEATRGAPNASGVKNATLRYDLPTPVVAVRNLVCHATLSLICPSCCSQWCSPAEK